MPKKSSDPGGGDRVAIRRKNYLKYHDSYMLKIGSQQLTDEYINSLLSRHCRPRRVWPQELIKLKRAQIMLVRAIRGAREKQKKAGVWGRNMRNTRKMPS